MKIFNLYIGYDLYGGAEKVAVNIHKALRNHGLDSYLAGLNIPSKNHAEFRIKDQEYVQLNFKNVFLFKNAIVFSHHRKLTTLLIIINKLLRLKMRIIHIAHNEFYNLKYATLLPDQIVAVSQRVKQNLIDVFKVDPDKIKIIYNGLNDEAGLASHKNEIEKPGGKISILYPGRITNVKRQVEVVKNMEGKLKEGVVIHFAGVGEESDKLNALIEKSGTFKSLGFVSIPERLPLYDYVMLFSSKEGLPLTLIEACMFSKPIICNDVGGNAEVVKNGYNGFVRSDFDELAKLCNSLPVADHAEYKKMAGSSREVFKDKFQMEKMVNNYINLIQDVNS
jgi:glycosyltransferase involved in cell wall biosynthesis